MHRAKIWHDDRPLGLDRRDQVFALLMEEKSLHSLNRLVPAQFKLDKLSEDDCCWPGFVPLDFLPRIIIQIEAGARVDDMSLGYIHGHGWESVCLPDREFLTQMQGGYLVSREVAAGESESQISILEYLSGMSLLFEEQGFSMHANGGRVKISGKKIKMERALEGFGRCMITKHERSCTCRFWYSNSPERFRRFVLQKTCGCT
ncbi:hypothetical protein HO173_012986 [Letharia columbiana]|uniref:Uncharacterized protein n=1 Tax=Letharia columbiana TaxID=112416 RepID=A0A8H6FE90_9LECA|nr:uncharacterized protein HO173_012986 [Letharia columbiana]KAF6224643.1 hypothetical protein HO173_012986 [Letharia columbiana]